MNSLPYILNSQQYHRQYADALDAFVEGKPVEFWDTLANGWKDEPRKSSEWSLTPHRPKPEPKVRPWSKPEDVRGRFAGFAQHPRVKRRICVSKEWLWRFPIAL